jgi:UDP-N-acetylmuramoyl-tripeptide--D-alanyl-D-alanine ligase
MNISDFYLKYFRENNVAIDSRKIKPGDIFIALKGDNFNGNTFAGDALELGASVAVIDDKSYLNEDPRLHYVDNSLTFLQKIAQHHRRKIEIPIIGITGTNGKTTTKELIKWVLAQKYRCKATLGNLNNHIGVPLTLLSFDRNTDIGIVEMGANHVGEIAALSSIAEPDSGLITNIGMAHLEGFRSFEGVKKAKSELYSYLMNHQGKIYVNGGDELLLSLAEGYNNKIIYNSPSGNCSARILSNYPKLELLLTLKNSTVHVRSNIYGNYNISNLLAAVSIGIDMGMAETAIKSALESYVPADNRSERLVYGSTEVIFDCYNANPTSMKEALTNFNQYPSENKIVILGGMKELGVYAEEAHQEIGRLIESLSFSHVILAGKEFGPVNVRHANKIDSVQEIKNILSLLPLENSIVLVKGSRANKLEQLKEYFTGLH